MYKLKNFEDFLTEKHADQYVGLDDDMPEDCGDWISNLDPQGLSQFQPVERFQSLLFQPISLRLMTTAPEHDIH